MGLIFDIEPLTKKLTFPIIMAISNALMVIILRIARNIQFDKNNPDSYLFSHPFMFTWLVFVSESFILIIYFLSRRPHIIKPKDKLNTMLNNSQDISLIPQECQSISSHMKQTKDYIMKNPQDSKPIIVGNITKKIILQIGTCVLLDYISCAGTLINRETNIYFLDFAVKALLIFFTSLFSIKLKFQFHKHHVVGILIVLVGIFIFTLNEILDVFILEPNSTNLEAIITWLPFFICLAVVVQLLTAGQECNEKYMMQYNYIDPFLMKGLEGVIGTIIASLLFIPYQLIKCPNFNLNICFRNGDYPIEHFFKAWGFMLQHWQMIICLICFMVSCFLFQLYRVLTNHMLSPNHRALADTLSTLIIAVCYFFFQLFELFNSKIRPIWFYIVGGISYIIMFFGILIVLEIIIVKLWNLDVNTFKNIAKRGTQDISAEEVESVTGNNNEN